MEQNTYLNVYLKLKNNKWRHLNLIYQVIFMIFNSLNVNILNYFYLNNIIPVINNKIPIYFKTNQIQNSNLTFSS